MTVDLLIKNVHIPGATDTTDVAVTDGTIAAMGQNLAHTAGESIEGSERLLTTPFVDSHFHLDSVLTGLPNESGTLREGIDTWDTYKTTTLTVDDIVDRASRYCELAIRQGILAVRSHVDVSDQQLRTVEGLLEVRRRFADRMDIQLVAFPQDGFYGSPETRNNLLKALDMGVDVVGGIPHNEPTYSQGTESIYDLLDIAHSRGLMVDMHCDESDDPHSRHIETLAAATIERGMQGRVTASHITASATYDRYYLSRRLIPLMQRAALSVVTNPLINVHLGGHFSWPVHRAIAPIKDYLDAGLTVACAQDCVQDPWYPLGNADMFEVARMAGHIAHLMKENDFDRLFHLVTDQPARIIGYTNYGMTPGNPADMVLFQATSVKDALRTSPPREMVFRRGKRIV